MSIFAKYGVTKFNRDPLLFTTDNVKSTENTSFVVGFNASGTVTENHIDVLGQYSTRLQVAGVAGTSEVAWVTDTMVELTAYSSLKITWAQNGDANNNNSSRLCVSTSKNDDSTVFDLRLSNTNTFSKQTDTLDISTLSGQFYIRIHARDNSGSVSVSSDLLVYEIELE